MSTEQYHIINARVILADSILDQGELLVAGGRIAAVGRKLSSPSGTHTIDAAGRYLAPGFIDIHVHGGGGHDFMDGTETAFLSIAALHARHGTTAMMPTTLSGSREELLHTLVAYQQAIEKNLLGAQFLGMHIEGPYFAMNQRGAQDPKYIRNPDPAEYLPILDHAPFIKRWSAAPELPGALSFGDHLVARGVLPSYAHTEAIHEDIVAALAHGYTLATHLYSGMLGVTRRNAFRYAGAVESAFLLDAIDVEIIADGVHLPVPLLQLIYKIKGADRIALITDAMRAAGMPGSESILGSLENGIPVIVEDGVAKLPDRTAFAGSVATADRLARTMVQQAEIPLTEVIKMSSATPARILGVHGHKGSLQPGMDADIILFDEDIRISLTMIGGRIVFDQAG